MRGQLRDRRGEPSRLGLGPRETVSGDVDRIARLLVIISKQLSRVHSATLLTWDEPTAGSGAYEDGIFHSRTLEEGMQMDALDKARDELMGKEEDTR